MSGAHVRGQPPAGYVAGTGTFFWPESSATVCSILCFTKYS
jgi:hypothetical protein